MSVNGNEKSKDGIDTFFGVSPIKGQMPEVCAPAGTASWYRFRWKVKACIGRVQKELVAPETQDWARFDCALDSVVSTI